MSNLKLVPPDGPTALEALLLNAVRSEAPSVEHKARLRAVLGLPLPFSSPIAAPAPAPPLTAPAPAPAPPLTAPAAAASSSFVAVKVAAAAVAVLGALAFAQLRTRPPQVEGARASVAVGPSAPSPSQVTPQGVAVTAPPEPAAVEPAPRAIEELPATPVLRAARRPSPQVVDLSPQIRLIEAARAGVAAGDSAAALRTLDDYTAQFPRGSFGQEASVLRISAVEQSGDVARASAMAKAFLARHPASPHVARVKAIAERGRAR